MSNTTKGLLKRELAGLVGDIWKALRGFLGSHTTWAAAAALAAPRICAVFGCDAIEAKHALLAFGGWAAKEAAKNWGMRAAAAKAESEAPVE